MAIAFKIILLAVAIAVCTMIVLMFIDIITDFRYKNINRIIEAIMPHLVKIFIMLIVVIFIYGGFLFVYKFWTKM